MVGAGWTVAGYDRLGLCRPGVLGMMLRSCIGQRQLCPQTERCRRQVLQGVGPAEVRVTQLVDRRTAADGAMPGRDGADEELLAAPQAGACVEDNGVKCAFDHPGLDRSKDPGDADHVLGAGPADRWGETADGLDITSKCCLVKRALQLVMALNQPIADCRVVIDHGSDRVWL